MRRILLVLAVIALLTASALPAMADQGDNNDWWGHNNNNNNSWGNNSDWWGHNNNNNNSWGNNNTFCNWYPSWWGWHRWCYSPWWGWWQVW
jgi:hypothetical protein